MARSARIVSPDVPYHVTQRGNYRQNVFEDDIDKETYMNWFQEYAQKYKVKLYAWCLMTNHVHFVVEPSTENGLAELFKNTQMRYSHYFNRKHKVFGHLWQGRFFSCSLDDDHLYEALRYVELNPLRAGMVQTVYDYAWSSARDHLFGTNKIALASVQSYLEIEDWAAYLQEEANEEVVTNLRSNLH